MAQSDQENLSRRKALKLIAATTGSMTLLNLPRKWVQPRVEIGVLPAHAQISPTALPLHNFTGCSVINANPQFPFIGPFDTMTMSTTITAPDPGIQIRRTITLNEPGHPQDGVVDVVVGTTDATGTYTGPDFDVSTLSPQISPGMNRIILLWEFVSANEGVGTCSVSVEIVG